MKRIIVVGMIIILFGVLVSGAEEILIVGEDSAPFEFLDDGEVVGLNVDVVREVLKRMGHKAVFELFSWKYALSMVEKGKADAILSCSKKPDREVYLYYPESFLYKSEYVFFTKKNTMNQLSVSRYADLKGVRVGVIAGYSYNDEFWAADLDTYEAESVRAGLKMLNKGRFDVLLLDKTVGLYNAKLLRLTDKLDFFGFVAISKQYPMPFSKNSKLPDVQELMKQFDQELHKFKQTGEYQKIRKKWLGK